MKNQSSEGNIKTEVCPKCGSNLGEIVTTSTGRRLQRCVAGSWDSATRKTIGCDFVKWFEIEPVKLDEKCPKCSAQLVLALTRFGKKMKKCSKGGWDKETKKATGCEYVEWINGTTEPLDEECPACGEKLVLYTTTSNKKMKKCSTGGWDRAAKRATGCTYVYWFKGPDYAQYSHASNAASQKTGEEFLPPEK